MPIDAAADATLMMLPPCRHDLPRHFLSLPLVIICRCYATPFHAAADTAAAFISLIDYFLSFDYFRLFRFRRFLFYAMLQMLLMPC